ncbi:YolD-like family protein [Paenibacillus sp. MMS18-CY102]|uniref:YolD-like family protein n=1 Tax=Paenibacillus sp. MMS18-CY102 TaxID=2682849 RepID=UPI0013665155|nr:YolD-like family protein [Paenibacillus sp. MMS18-CY102]MWC29911.1 YolD-like family protein [Paenibacillus sp. MMS18-CY102]
MAKAKVPKRPTRDEFVLEEIGNQITEAYNEKSDILLTIWGWEEPLRGQIVHLDSRTGKVHVQKKEETVKVPFMDIMSLDYPRD